MGYSSIEALNMLYMHIANSNLFQDVKKPNGKLCKFSRPLNSDGEDVVLNSLGLDQDDVQEGVKNVNVYVKNLHIPGDPDDDSQPDTARILYLSKLVKQVLHDGEEFWDESGEWCFKLQQDRVEPDINNFHYINFRVEFNLIN